MNTARTPNTYEVQKWNGVLQWAQKHSKSGSGLEAGALGTSGWAQAKKTGPNQSKSDKPD